MKTYKHIFMIFLIFSLLCFFTISMVNKNASAEETSETTSFTIKDEFDVNPVSESKAIKVVGIAGDGNATHGAIPAEEWGDPAKIADESYLIYEIGDGSSSISGLYITLDAKVWGQNNDEAYATNKINIYLGNTEDSQSNLVYTKSAYGSTDLFEDGIDLSSYIDSSFTKAYVKVELVQSKVSCGNESCTNGRHSCGTSATVATPDGYSNLHYFGTRIFKITLSTSAPMKDTTQPVPNDFKYDLNEEVYAMEEYTFPEIVFTDDVDGVVDYEITYTDPYNNSYDLGKNAKSFTPEYEGIYTFSISASDSSENTYTDKFSVSAVVKPGNPVIYFENVPEKNGRVGNVYNIEPLKYDDGETYEISVSVTAPDDTEVEVSNMTFTPDQIGEYKIVYTASNANGSTKLFNRVYVKYNTNGEDPYKIWMNKVHWRGNVNEADGAISIEGRAYSYLPFSLEEGLKMTFTLSEEANAWLGLYITRTSHYGNYYFEAKQYTQNKVKPGLYILMYKDNDDSYYCNIDYMGLSGGVMTVANHSYCGGTSNEVTIQIKKDESSDTIRFYVNGQKNENYELNNSVLASVISDNEGFSYIGFGNVQHGTPILDSMDICDSTAPEIEFSSELPTTLSKGETATLPTIKAVDAHDGEMPYTESLYSPDGKLVDITNRTVTFDQDGVYYYIVQSKDLSNNENYSIMEIKSGDTSIETYFEAKKESKSGCKSSLSLTSLLIPTILIGFFIERRKENER